MAAYATAAAAPPTIHGAPVIMGIPPVLAFELAADSAEPVDDPPVLIFDALVVPLEDELSVLGPAVVVLPSAVAVAPAARAAESVRITVNPPISVLLKLVLAVLVTAGPEIWYIKVPVHDPSVELVI